MLLPEPLAPLGEADLAGLTFRWLWRGPDTMWHLVLLDAGMEELVTVQDIRGTSLVPVGKLLKHLQKGGRFHWFVAYTTLGQRFGSLPVPLIISQH